MQSHWLIGAALLAAVALGGCKGDRCAEGKLHADWKVVKGAIPAGGRVCAPEPGYDSEKDLKTFFMVDLSGSDVDTPPYALEAVLRVLEKDGWEYLDRTKEGDQVVVEKGDDRVTITAGTLGGLFVSFRRD